MSHTDAAGCCAHCGLPAAPPRIYCCNGCAVAAAILASAGEGRPRAIFLRLGLAAFFSCNVMLLTLLLYSDASIPAPVATLVRALLLCLTVPVFLLLVPPFLTAALQDARRLRFSMDSLIAAGSGAAFAYSVLSVVRGTGEVYFDTAAMVLMLVTVGRFLEAHAHVSCSRAVRELMDLAPPAARVFREGAWQMADARGVAPGERVQVLAGERIPVDGRIVAGAAAVDESMLTGESLPAERVAGESVHAGALSQNGVLEIECTAAETLLARIVRAVEEAQRERSPRQRLADRLAAVLVPVTVALAAVVAAAGSLLDALAVLVVACPCALGIALPMVNVMALGAAARRGILVRSTETLEHLAEVDTIAFDKTGTLTAGRIRIRDAVPRHVLAAAATAAAGSVHPVSRAILAHARAEAVTPEPCRRVEELPGRGLRVEPAGGGSILLGQPRWIAAELATRVPDRGAVWCARDGRLLGGFELEDPVTPEAVAALEALGRRGLRLVLLSGDRPEAVARAAKALGLDQAHGGLLPEEKAAFIRNLAGQGRRTAMVGDGINDAPALAAAEVGIAASGGTDTARETARVVFLQPGLDRLVYLIDLARRARRTGRQNLAWTLSYNTIALGLAAGGQLKPLWAAALMLASSISVIVNARRVA